MQKCKEYEDNKTQTSKCGHIFSFAKNNNFDKRKESSQSILKSYQGVIPIVVEEFKLSKGRSDCESFQLIMFGHYTTCHISRFIRRKLKLDETKNLMFHVVQEGTAKMIGPSDTLSEHYNNWKSEDGFLYILYHFESTF